MSVSDPCAFARPLRRRGPARGRLGSARACGRTDLKALRLDSQGEIRLFPGNPASIYGPEAARQPAFFPATKTVPVPHAPRSLGVGDFDADGLSDAIVGGATTLDSIRIPLPVPAG